MNYNSLILRNRKNLIEITLLRTREDNSRSIFNFSSLFDVG